MKTYAPQHDDHQRSPWRRPSNRRPTTHEQIEAQLDEAQIDAREYSELAQELADDEAGRLYRSRAAEARHRAATIAAHIERTTAP